MGVLNRAPPVFYSQKQFQMEKPNFKQFVDAVQVMRLAQQNYFSSRVPDALRYAKAKEAEVDKMILKLKNMEPDHVKTPELFR